MQQIKSVMSLRTLQSLLIFGLFCVGFLSGCTAPQKTTDSRLDKAIAESEKNKSEKLDFLKDEKLPNEKFTATDSSALTGDYAEIPPTIPARYRVQLFSGTAANARKVYQQYVSAMNSTEAYVIYDVPSGTWKVWAGNYQNKSSADSAKLRLIEAGYADAWVREISDEQNAPLRSASSSNSLFWVQLGSFQRESSAQQLLQKIRTDLKDQVIIKTVGNTYKIWVGGFSDRKQAEDLKNRLRQMGYSDGFIVQGQE